MSIGRAARALMTLVALALLAPVLGLSWRDETALARFHNRTLAPWPAGAAFANPPEAFRQARAWLADRAWPVVDAVGLQKRILYFVLSTPPAHKMTIGLDGQLFLTSWNEAEPDVLIDALCVKAHGAAAKAGLTRALGQLAAYAQRSATPVDVIIVPTTATLYAQRLPSSVQQRFRDGCKAVAAGRTSLREIPVPAGTTFLYPFDLFAPHLDDPAFYPRNHWHASGRSLVVLRDAWLAAIGLARAIDERIEAAPEPAEILEMSGVTDLQPAYAVRNAHVHEEPSRNAALRAAVADLFTKPDFWTRAYANDAAPVDGSILMVSDSFGQRAAAVFAGAFSDVVQVTTNDLEFDGVPLLIERARALRRVDRIVLMFQEGSVDRPINYAYLLQRYRAAPRSE